MVGTLGQSTSGKDEKLEIEFSRVTSDSISYTHTESPVVLCTEARWNVVSTLMQKEIIHSGSN